MAALLAASDFAILSFRVMPAKGDWCGVRCRSALSGLVLATCVLNADPDESDAMDQSRGERREKRSV